MDNALTVKWFRLLLVAVACVLWKEMFGSMVMKSEKVVTLLHHYD